MMLAAAISATGIGAAIGSAMGLSGASAVSAGLAFLGGGSIISGDVAADSARADGITPPPAGAGRADLFGQPSSWPLQNRVSYGVTGPSPMVEGYVSLAKNAQDAKVWQVGKRNIVGWLKSLRTTRQSRRGRRISKERVVRQRRRL